MNVTLEYKSSAEIKTKVSCSAHNVQDIPRLHTGFAMLCINWLIKVCLRRLIQLWQQDAVFCPMPPFFVRSRAACQTALSKVGESHLSDKPWFTDGQRTYKCTRATRTTCIGPKKVSEALASSLFQWQSPVGTILAEEVKGNSRLRNSLAGSEPDSQFMNCDSPQYIERVQ